MDIFTGTHCIRITRDDKMMDGFRVQIAQEDGNRNIISEFTADNTKLYKMKYGARAVYAQIILHLLPLDDK